MTPGFEAPAVLVIVTPVVVPAGAVGALETEVEIAALLKVDDVKTWAPDGPVVVGFEENAGVVTLRWLRGVPEMSTRVAALPRKISTIAKMTKGERGPSLFNHGHRGV